MIAAFTVIPLSEVNDTLYLPIEHCVIELSRPPFKAAGIDVVNCMKCKRGVLNDQKSDCVLMLDEMQRCRLLVMLRGHTTKWKQVFA